MMQQQNCKNISAAVDNQMNVIVKTYSGRVIVRPDTSWEKDNEDFYPQDFVDRISFTPVVFARICKPGKSIGIKFAERYYDGINCGMLLYPEDLIDGSAEGFACASCIDHTSFLPFPLYNPETLNDKTRFSIYKNGNEIYNNQYGSRVLIEKTISEATTKIHIRTGDIIAVELDSRKLLMSRESGNSHITGILNGKTLLDFNIIIE